MSKILSLVLVVFCFSCAKTSEKSSCNDALFKRVDQYVKNNGFGDQESQALTDMHTLGDCVINEGSDRALVAFRSFAPLLDGSFMTSYIYISEAIYEKEQERLKSAGREKK